MTIVFMASRGGFCDVNASHWWYQKHPLFTSQTFSDNISWETAIIHMSVAKEAIRKTTGRFNAMLECWQYTKSPRYHADRFHIYRNCPKQYVTGRVGACEVVNSKVCPTQFNSGREQGFQGCPKQKSSDILNHNTFHF